MQNIIRQHLIDPEICIRCNTCEATCPVGAITHDARNYVVNVEICNGCQACVPPCPTGSIDNWRDVPKAQAYSVGEQLGWDELPVALEGISVDEPLGLSLSKSNESPTTHFDKQGANGYASIGSIIAPHSAATPVTNLHTPKNPITAKVVGNYRVTQLGTESDTHHIVLDFGTQHFPVLEGQSIGIIPNGVDASGKPHYPRQYSIASPRNGERAGYNNLALTVKRVLVDHDGKPTVGVASNYVCDLKVGDDVQVTGPFGASFLMPNHAGSNIVMICTGTGSAPMRAMTEWRRRERATGAPNSGKLMLFFGARTKEELPYFGPLQKLPKDFIDIHFAFSRAPDPLGHGSKRYVQDVMREQVSSVAALLKDANTYLYVCGLKSMEAGVLAALKDIATAAGQNWDKLSEDLRVQGRLHLETY
ncbi:MAG: benzoyl-CoA 2,3-epoxidase subunit BoxA [Cytophagales bacterium]|nr:benzoyl-CoA 2,3-epoxidase subunit BoxA [Cytophagales bacterium]